MIVGETDIRRLEVSLRQLLADGKTLQDAIAELKRSGIGMIQLIEPVVLITGMARSEALRTVHASQSAS